MKKKKGEYGYRDSHKKMCAAIICILILFILAQLGARMLTDSQSVKNILTVMAVLTVLPMANMASPMLASWKYKTPAPGFYEKTASYETKCDMLYDLIITSKDFVMPADAIAVHPNGVIVYCTGRKIEEGAAERFLTGMLRSHKFELPVKVIKEETVFFRRLDQLKPASEYEEDSSIPYVEALLKNISM